MKIINENEKPYITTCECNSIIEFNEADITTAQYGCACIICPKCGKRITVDDIVPNYEKFEKHITKDNISFPQDFYDNSICSNVNDKKINYYIKRGIEDIEQNKNDSYFYPIANTVISIFSADGGYEVQVSKNYYDTFINKE